MCAGAGFTPGERVELVLDRKAKQLVPCRVKLDRVDAGPIAVVSLQLRGVFVRLDGVPANFGTASERSNRSQPLRSNRVSTRRSSGNVEIAVRDRFKS